MRLVLQRVSTADVEVEGTCCGSCSMGYMILVGIAPTDTREIVEKMWEKTKHLRVFEDEHQKMNKSLLDVGGSILAISQFTLYANCRHGRRPSFTDAARPDSARELYDYFCTCIRRDGVELGCGVFGADMTIHLTCTGPVTIMLDSNDVLSA